MKNFFYETKETIAELFEDWENILFVVCGVVFVIGMVIK